MQEVDALLADVGEDAGPLEHGEVLARLGSWPQSTWDGLSQAAIAAPLNGDFCWLLGLRALQCGHSAEAVELLCQAIALCPDHALAQTALGQAMAALDLPAAAIECFTLAIKWDPNLGEPFFYRGNTLYQLGRWEPAIDDYRQAIARLPALMQAHNNLGLALTRLGRHPLAVESLSRAVELAPDRAEPHCNLGVALYGAGRLREAVSSYDRALALDPLYAEAANNRGNALWDLGYKDPEQRITAIDSYELAIALKPDYEEAYWNKALALLQTGDYAHGWALHEWRWKRRAFAPIVRNFDCPLWLGQESLQNKTILLHGEQGLGDSIQFCRYAALVQQLGARVVLEVDASLVGLLGSLQGPEQVIARGTGLPPTDFHCPLLSLPLAFQTTLGTVPASGAYLRPDTERLVKWDWRLGPKRAPRVGLVWSGDPTHRNDHKRSLPLKTLLAYLPNGYEYISLQKDVRESDRADLAARPDIRDMGQALSDFSETAAACAGMDFLITVDTSFAHLSAALGKPTWILMAAPSDWRWLLDREDSPWYNSARLFRQQTPGDWHTALTRIACALEIDLPRS
jgi:tetratricopeptide (TPR) repeat protein